MELGINGRKAIVTGGSKGIGLAIARELVDESVAVAICACNQEDVVRLRRNYWPAGRTRSCTPSARM